MSSEAGKEIVGNPSCQTFPSLGGKRVLSQREKRSFKTCRMRKSFNPRKKSLAQAEKNVLKTEKDSEVYPRNLIKEKTRDEHFPTMLMGCEIKDDITTLDD